MILALGIIGGIIVGAVAMVILFTLGAYLAVAAGLGW